MENTIQNFFRENDLFLVYYLDFLNFLAHYDMYYF